MSLAGFDEEGDEVILGDFGVADGVPGFEGESGRAYLIQSVGFGPIQGDIIVGQVTAILELGEGRSNQPQILNCYRVFASELEYLWVDNPPRYSLHQRMFEHSSETSA